MTTLDGAHVLVLGATGGLGSAIAHRLTGEGARLTLSARDPARLATLADSLGDSVLTTVPADLTRPDAPTAVLARASAAAPLDGIVNAAGVVAFGDAADLDDDTFDELLLLDLVAPVRLVRAAAEHLAEGGFVAQVSAVVAERPMPGMAAYSAVKAGLTAFDAAVATELRRRRIRVLDARPPHTETGLADRPIAGSAPRLPQGLDPAVVAARIVQAILDDERDLPSTAF
ncbi:short-chain dehydrogenase [Intrasporangium oryzae NRRL B-24470]|uniref:Short-chain dehydrogenase n=1 Tax=Intrasporangium oryzae NRRL B-24470 TaxID=1386089 RepID=W9GF88_9MICO|nr:SDR family NAD(P)-dependent oxidoreductase [Intrasporangium oryzae]EWT02504.1 short-chain dehydrogenase [Intrasporangium oryzae NRRL B-24470]